MAENYAIRMLPGGAWLPAIGYGTWQTPDGDTAKNAVEAAIRAGYRLIDGAAAYDNEVSVGAGIKASGVKREELFLTSKLWNTERGYDKTMAAFEKTLADLGTDYLDLYLIHWPAAAHQYKDWEKLNAETWRAMCDLYKAGRVRAIGVSNFKPRHLDALMKTEIPPMIDQIEFHPGFRQEETVAFCFEHQIAVEAWSPLGTGRMLKNPELKRIAAKYGKSTAQLCIRWCIQNQVIPLPKSVTPSRIRENLDVFDFEISKADMRQINAMPYIGGSGLDPDKIDF